MSSGNNVRIASTPLSLSGMWLTPNIEGNIVVECFCCRVQVHNMDVASNVVTMLLHHLAVCRFARARWPHDHLLLPRWVGGTFSHVTRVGWGAGGGGEWVGSSRCERSLWPLCSSQYLSHMRNRGGDESFDSGFKTRFRCKTRSTL